MKNKLTSVLNIVAENPIKFCSFLLVCVLFLKGYFRIICDKKMQMYKKSIVIFWSSYLYSLAY